MQPLKILAFATVGLPISIFLLTLLLTDGAPLQPPAPGEEGRPAAATRNPPQNELELSNLERGSRVAATGHRSPAAPGDIAAQRFFDHDRDAQLFITLFGIPRSE